MTVVPASFLQVAAVVNILINEFTGNKMTSLI